MAQLVDLDNQIAQLDESNKAIEAEVVKAALELEETSGVALKDSSTLEDFAADRTETIDQSTLSVKDETIRRLIDSRS